MNAVIEDILVDYGTSMDRQFFQLGKQPVFSSRNIAESRAQMLEVRKTPKTKGQQTRRDKLVGVSLIGLGDFTIPFVRDTKLMQIV
jgi:hypothetical protein